MNEDPAPVIKATAPYSSSLPRKPDFVSSLPRKPDFVRKLATPPPRLPPASKEPTTTLATARNAPPTSVAQTAKAPAQAEGVSFARLAAATDRSDDIADFEEDIPLSKSTLGKRARKNAAPSGKEKDDEGDVSSDPAPSRRLVSLLVVVFYTILFLGSSVRRQRRRLVQRNQRR